MRLPKPEDLAIATLAEAGRPSPLSRSHESFVDGASPVLIPRTMQEIEPYLRENRPPPAFEPAGPRSRVLFDPEHVSFGVVTCGGLCPGLNDVVRSVVLSARHVYGVRRILGFRYGYAGLAKTPGAEPQELTPESVAYVHHQGGAFLGSSRGPVPVAEMADVLEARKIDALFAIGGDGTLRGASALAAEISRRGVPIAVIGIPKTIDNDLLWTDRTFGFDTAVNSAHAVLAAAHSEATASFKGVGLVKLMGRHSGFIAAMATLASGDVNFCLVPEVPFTLEGRGGLLESLEQRLDTRGHGLIVVAEGAGQELLASEAPEQRDASGNVKLLDIGIFLRDRIREHFQRRGSPVDLKYIDPSYTIRSLPANSLDSAFCLSLGQHAVHAAMSGRTDLMIGFWSYRFVHVPLQLAVGRRKHLRPQDEIWQRVLGTTGQPQPMVGANPGANPRGRPDDEASQLEVLIA